MATRTRKPLRFILVGLGALVLVLTGLAAWWVMDDLDAQDWALRSLGSTDTVKYSRHERGWLVFEPVASPASRGFVFYPGAKVDPAAYAPMARDIADRGYLVVVVPMPLRLAILGADAGKEVLRAFPRVETWAIGGHSMGGAMAGEAVRNTVLYKGLVLLGAYVDTANDLSRRSNLDCLVISASEDRVVKKDKLDAGWARLPPDTIRVVIDGGNHAHFGAYGPQQGDGTARIDSQEQMRLCATYISDFMDLL